MIWKKPANQPAQPQVNLKFCFVFFGFSHYIQQCDGMLVGPRNFCLFGNWVRDCLKPGYCELIVLRQQISWLDCTVVIVGIIFWHPVRLFATTNPPFHFSPPPPVAGLAGLQGTCSFALFLSLFFFFVHVCVCPCLHGWCRHGFHPFIRQRPDTPILTSTHCIQEHKEEAAVCCGCS